MIRSGVARGSPETRAEPRRPLWPTERQTIPPMSATGPRPSKDTTAAQARQAQQTLSDVDQTLSDADQTLSDADQTNSDREQACADRDQLAADIDQAARDRALNDTADHHTAPLVATSVSATHISASTPRGPDWTAPHSMTKPQTLATKQRSRASRIHLPTRSRTQRPINSATAPPPQPK